MKYNNQLTDLMKDMNNDIQHNVKTSYLAQIVKLTPPVCSVQPLAMINGKKLPMVEDVHFITYPIQYQSKYIDTVGKQESQTKRKLIIKNPKLTYHKGDDVLVDVLDLDDSYYQGNGKFNVGSVRRHSMDFSVIVGKVAKKNDFKTK